jgi:hypothetical protein
MHPEGSVAWDVFGLDKPTHAGGCVTEPHCVQTMSFARPAGNATTKPLGSRRVGFRPRIPETTEERQHPPPDVGLSAEEYAGASRKCCHRMSTPTISRPATQLHRHYVGNDGRNAFSHFLLQRGSRARPGRAGRHAARPLTGEHLRRPLWGARPAPLRTKESAYPANLLGRSLHWQGRQPTDVTRTFREWAFSLLDTHLAGAGECSYLRIES